LPDFDIEFAGGFDDDREGDGETLVLRLIDLLLETLVSATMAPTGLSATLTSAFFCLLAAFFFASSLARCAVRSASLLNLDVTSVIAARGR
jgi:hypothetical protein